MLWSRGEARLARRPHISQRLTWRICWRLRCRKVEYSSHRSGDGEEPWGPRQICSRLRLVFKRPGAFPTCASIPRQRRSTSRSALSSAPGLPARPVARPISRSMTRGPGPGSICASLSIRLSSTPPFPVLPVAHAARQGRSRFLGRAVAVASANCSRHS